MLHVIFMILKIIGMILAALLCLILLVLLIVLFVPVRYRGFAERKEKLQAQVKVSWLLHIVSVPVTFQDGALSVKLKLFGFTFKDFMEEEEALEEDAQEFFGDTEDAVRQKETDLLAHEGDLKAEEKAAEEEHVQAEPEPFESKQPKEAQADRQGEALSNEASVSKEPGRLKSFWEKLKAIGRAVVGISKKIRNLKYTFRRFCVKIKRMIKKVRDTKDFLMDERTQAAVQLCLMQVKLLLKRLLPRRIQGEVHFGTSDPALTGQILGGISIFYPIFMDNVKVNPDFEQSCLEGELHFKGRFRLATAALIAFRLLRNKNVWYVYRKLSR